MLLNRNMEDGLTLTFPSNVDFNFNKNLSLFLTSSEISNEVSASAEADPEYEQFLADVWVGIVLTLMVLSCVCCMCSCLLYHKFQQWKRSVIEARNATNVEVGNSESESLPSYTIVSGLPSYDEAIEQLKKVKELHKSDEKTNESSTTENGNWIPRTPPTPMATLSVMELFQKYKNSPTQEINDKLS